MPNNNAFSDILKEETDSSVLQGTFQTNVGSRDSKSWLLESAVQAETEHNESSVPNAIP